LNDIAATIREALDAGLNTQALDLARASGVDGERAAEIDYLAALASVRMGATREAEQWLAHIDRERLGASPLAVEVWSLAGRIAKDRFATTADRDSGGARDALRTAIACYERAFALGGSAYPAVNAATLAMLAGNAPRARVLATRALAAPGQADDHWSHASAGEALLLLGRLDDARAQYAEAHRRAGARFGDIASMRRQLALIGTPAARALGDTLPAPQVIAFSGHMIDRAERAIPRFPARIEARVAAAVQETIARLGPSLGYAQAACGADILFLEAVQGAGGQTQIVLPFAPAHFIDTSVRFAGDAWVRRFENVLEQATRVVLATDEPFLGDDVLFEHAANLIQGMAFLRARELSTQPLMLTVREPGGAELVGGTAATTRHWTRRGGRVENIDLVALRAQDAGAMPPAAARESEGRRSAEATAAPTAGPHATRGRTLKSLLFADISGYTRMPEQYTPDFAEMFLGRCKAILDSLEHGAIEASTSGDGLFAVFESPSHAAECAVRLQQALCRVDWPALGLAAETGARIGLHTGPLFRVFNAVTGRPAFYGTHINRTARLEPIVQPRHIFVTEEFAASLVADSEDRFRCDYIGTMPLAKRFGDARLYRLRWTDED
jgi:tetratricopeptide (TPR) repeat protein